MGHGDRDTQGATPARSRSPERASLQYYVSWPACTEKEPEPTKCPGFGRTFVRATTVRAELGWAYRDVNAHEQAGPGQRGAWAAAGLAIVPPAAAWRGASSRTARPAVPGTWMVVVSARRVPP